MKSFQVGDKVRIKKGKDRYDWFSGGLHGYTIGCTSLGQMRDEGVVLTVESLEYSDLEEKMGVNVVEHNYIMAKNDLELVGGIPFELFSLKQYVELLDKDHPARKEYEELMECKFHLEMLEKEG